MVSLQRELSAANEMLLSVGQEQKVKPTHHGGAGDAEGTKHRRNAHFGAWVAYTRPTRICHYESSGGFAGVLPLHARPQTRTGKGLARRL